MTDQPASRARQRSARGPLYWLVFGLVGALTLYMLFWTYTVIAVVGWDARVTIFGADIYNAVQHADAYIIALVGITGALAFASFSLFAFRSRRAIVGMMLTVGAHLALWLSLIGNPYYSGDPGYILIPVEIVLTALMILLIRRGVLR